jgi:hypothetical protein
MTLVFYIFTLREVSNKEKSKYVSLKLIEIKNNKKRHQVSQLNIIIFTKNIKKYTIHLALLFTFLNFYIVKKLIF